MLKIISLRVTVLVLAGVMLFVLLTAGCGGSDNPSGANNGNEPPPDDILTPGTYLIEPIETDPDYAANEKSHYIVSSTEPSVNKMFLFIGGSFSVPKNYQIICDFVASIGFDVISLSYPNYVATAPLGTSSDALVFDDYRDEICFGNSVSKLVSVDQLNSIYTRTVKLLLYLNTAYPDQNWGQYLTAQDTPQWDKIIVAGHSQGSGHACYLGKEFSVDRVLMFSGPNDYSTYYDAPGYWLSQNGLTPQNRQFALLHVNDEMVPFDYQVENLRALGLLGMGESPTRADLLTSPYDNARALSIDVPANSNHASPIGSNSKLPDIWQYMLEAN